MYHIKIIVYTFIPLIIASAELSEREIVKPRVFGGRTTSIQELGGYAVQIYRSSRLVCTGSLLTQYHIVTSAHCFENDDYRKFHVVAGQTDSETFFYPDAVINSVAKLKIHSSFRKVQYIGDIAVLKVKNAIRGPDVGYLPICTQRLSAGMMVTVSGWGSSEMAVEHNPLRTITVPLISKTDCNRKMDSTLPDNVLCAAGYNQRTICIGDSGGPLVLNGQLCGVSTWTYKCGNKLMPDIYMNVNYYRDFIRKAIAVL